MESLQRVQRGIVSMAPDGMRRVWDNLTSCVCWYRIIEGAEKRRGWKNIVLMKLRMKKIFVKGEAEDEVADGVQNDWHGNTVNAFCELWV